MAKSKRDVVPNRMFLGYQWHTYRPLFEEACAEIHRQYPVYFYAVGRHPGQPAEALLERIKNILRSSTSAVFDASRGNPNVSLEYGMAHLMDGLQTYLLIDQHTLPNHINVGTPIISDLAGSTQNRWDIKDRSTLKAHLRAIAEAHPYTKRFKQYCRARKLVKGQFRTPLKVIRLFDERESILRREVLDQLQATWRNKKQKDIEKLVSDMHHAGLITVTRGREWASKVFIAQ